MPETRPSFLDFLRGLPPRVEAFGASGVARSLAGSFRRSFASKDRLKVFVQDAGGDAAAPDGIMTRRAVPGDAEAYARDIGTDTPASFVARLTPETWCLLVIENARLLHSSWVTTRCAWTQEVRAFAVPPPGDAYVYESFTDASARGRGLYPLALAALRADAAAHGIERVWVAVESHNAASLRSVTKAGFEEVFEVAITRHWFRTSIEASSGPRAALAAAFFVPACPDRTPG